MSTKIYTAWKFPQNRLNDFLLLVRKSVFKEEAKYWTNCMNRISNEETDKMVQEMVYPRLKNKPEILRKMAKYIIVSRRIEDGVREALSDPDKKRSLKESGINLWLYKGYYYCIPWGEYTGNHFSKVRFPNWVSDYSYWNNTDRPGNVLEKEWERRGKIWDEVCLGKVSRWSELRLTHEIFNYTTSFFYYGLEMENLLGLHKYFLM